MIFKSITYRIYLAKVIHYLLYYLNAIEVLILTANGSIGIFDSGVGGLTVVKALIEKLPNERFIYFGDTAHVPYGNKSEQELFLYARSIISFLLSKRVKAVIVACGTHSSVTLPVTSREYSLPLLGVVKAGASSAIRITRNGFIGIIATQATVNRLAYTQQIKALNKGFKVFEMACPKLVPLIEQGRLDGKKIREAIKEYLDPLIEQGIDTLVLGCTHYPFLAPLIKEYVGSAVTLVDPAYETIEELKMIFTRENLFNNKERLVNEFFVSGNDESFFTVGNKLLENTIKKVQRVDLN
jgi:glutamate racemase